MRMNGWKKAATGAFVLLLVLFVIACSKNEGSGGNTTTPPATTPPTNSDALPKDTEVAKPEDKLITLEWLTYQYGPVDENGRNKKIVEEKFNVKMNIWYMDVTKRQELLGAKLASGEIPDFMTVYNGADLQRFYSEGITTDYTQEELEQYMPNYKKIVDSVDPQIWDYVKFNGNYIGIPSINVDGQFSLATAWNQNWLEKLGITKTPETLEEMEEAVYKFRNDDPDGNNKKDTYGMSVSAMTNVYGAYGIYPEFWTIRDGQIVWSGILPETKQALEKLRQWKQDDVIDPEWVVGENTGGYWAVSNAFVNGKIGVSTHGSYYHWNPANPETGSLGGDNTKLFAEATQGNGKIALGKPPVGPAGKFGNITPGFVGTTYMAFGKDAADPDKKHRIMQIWDALYSDFDLYMNVRYGEKGVHYENGADGNSVVWKEGFQKNDEQAKIGAAITFLPFAQPEFWEKLQSPKGLENARTNFSFPGAGYSNAVKAPLASEGKYYQDLIKLQKDTFTAIINGDKPLDEFDKFVADWKSSGGWG